MSKVIVVLGNHNSGKTIFSYYMANALAQGDKKAVVISAENEYPSTAYLLQPQKEQRSLGKLLSSAIVNTKNVLQNIIISKSSNVGFLAYSVKENKNNYPKLVSSNIAAMFSALYGEVDYIIIDTGGTLTDIDNFALEQADKIVCITTADIKGLAFRDALPLSINIDSHILYHNSAFNMYDDIQGTFTLRVKYHMPFCREFGAIYNGLTPDEVDCPKKYAKFINNFIKEELTEDDQSSNSER